MYSVGAERTSYFSLRLSELIITETEFYRDLWIFDVGVTLKQSVIMSGEISMIGKMTH